MDSPQLKSFLFPGTRPEKKGYLPIRSIPYKKALGKKDLELKEEMLLTMSKFGASPLASGNQTLPLHKHLILY